MFLKTDPGMTYGRCELCQEEIAIPVLIEVELQEDVEGLPVRARIVKIDIQVMYDHQFEKHLSSFE